MTSLIGFEDMTDEQTEILHQIHILAREFEHIGNDGQAHYRIALIEELTKQPTSIEYMKEKLEGLFSVRINNVYHPLLQKNKDDTGGIP